MIKIILIIIVIFLSIILIEGILNNRRNLKNFQNSSYILKKEINKNKIPNIKENNNIPKKILQIYFQGENKLPSYVKDNVTKNNKDWEYCFFDEEKCYQFLRQYYDETYIEKMKSFKKYAHKADLFRVCWLYVNGGIYMDADMELFVSLNYLINNMEGLITTLQNDYRNNFYDDLISKKLGYKHKTLLNGLIISNKGNPLIKECINNIMKIEQKDLDNNYPLILFVMQHTLNKKITHYFFERSSNNYIPLMAGHMEMFDKNGKIIGNSNYLNYKNGKFK